MDRMADMSYNLKRLHTIGCMVDSAYGCYTPEDFNEVASAIISECKKMLSHNKKDIKNFDKLSRETASQPL